MDDRSVVTANDQTITCAITGLSQTATVSWTGPDGAMSDGTEYTVAQGTDDGSGAQDSTLTIKTAKLEALVALGTTSTFTCHITSGEYTESETSSKAMTLTTLTFGKFTKTYFANRSLNKIYSILPNYIYNYSMQLIIVGN